MSDQNNQNDKNANDLIERYLYDVIRRLPEKQKADIEKELRSLIDDMMAEREETAGSREEAVKSVLEELGSPAKLSRSYRGGHDSLLSGEYYDSYCYILKIVMICAAVGIVISNIVSAIVHVVEAETLTSTVWNDLVNIGLIPNVLVQIFAWVTLIFIIMERNNVKLNTNDMVWNLSKLPQIPSKKARIGRGESGAGVVFGIILIVILAFAPQLIGAWITQPDGSIAAYPLFNLSVWNRVLPLFIISIVLGIVDDLVKLIAGRYTYKTMTVSIITHIISFAVSVVIFKVFPIWNENFIPEIQNATGEMFNSKFDIMTYFNTDSFSTIIVLFLFAIMMIDIASNVYYTVRYGEQ